MNMITSIPSILFLCCSTLSITSAFECSLPSKQEAQTLLYIQALLQKHGDATDNESFWKSAAMKEMRSPQPPFITTQSNDRFSDAIHLIQSVIRRHHSMIKKHSPKKEFFQSFFGRHPREVYLSEEFVKVILPEMLNREINGTHFMHKQDLNRKVRKAISQDTLSHHSSSSTKMSPKLPYISSQDSSHDLTTDEQLSSFIRATESDQISFNSDSTK